jgi:hypothetical protein
MNLEKFGFSIEEQAQMSGTESAYPEFILGRDGEVYHLLDLYRINALPGKIDENGIIVPV